MLGGVSAGAGASGGPLGPRCWLHWAVPKTEGVRRAVQLPRRAPTPRRALATRRAVAPRRRASSAVGDGRRPRGEHRLVLQARPCAGQRLDVEVEAGHWVGARVGGPAARLLEHRRTRARRQAGVRAPVRARGGERRLLLPQVRQRDGRGLVPPLDDRVRVDGARVALEPPRLVVGADLRAHAHVVAAQLRAQPAQVQRARLLPPLGRAAQLAW